MIKNIFQIWDENNRTIPFKVRREHWPINCMVVVERIECEKLPYGKAFGFPIKDGVESGHFNYDKHWKKEKLIPSCGSYQWVLVND